MHIKAHLQLPSIQEQMKNCGLNEGGKVQKYIDSFVLHHSKPYEPGRRAIHNSGVNSTTIGEGRIIWNDVRANYLYEGWLMVDQLTQSAWARRDTQKMMDPKGRHLHYNGEPQKKDHWFDRMLESEMDDLVEGAQHIVDGGK